MIKISKCLPLVIAGLLFGATLPSNAQVVPVITDDFESYSPFQVCPNYLTDIQVYPIHGTNNSQGLRSFMNSFDSKDSLVIDWVKPLPSAYIAFDFRMMEASALYPNIPATLDNGDQFSLRYTSDNQTWITLQNWKANNFTPITAFTHIQLSVPPCDSAKFKFVITRTGNPNDYFVDIDNLDISNNYVGLGAAAPANELSVSPSPFNDFIRIQAPLARAYQFELIDMHGKLVASGELSGDETLVRTSDLPIGSYMVYITGADRVKTFRVIKAQ